jgi:hypothetical protein
MKKAKISCVINPLKFMIYQHEEEESPIVLHASLLPHLSSSIRLGETLPV